MKKLIDFNKDRRGLSTIVVTLIMILLVLVAVGIIWVVVRGLIETGTEQINLSSSCLKIEITAIVLQSAATTEENNLTLTRGAGGGDIGGIKVVFFNDTANSGVLDFGIALAQLETSTTTSLAGVADANKVEVTPYFIDASGNEELCSLTSTFDF